jgi:hypothetical protein
VTDDERRAYHESAHAIISEVLGARVTSVRAREELSCCGHESTSIENSAIIGIAGELCASMAGWDGELYGLTKSDLDPIVQFAESSGDPAKAVEHIANRAEVLIRQHWPKIEQLARELQDTWIVPGSRVRAILAGADPAPRHVRRLLIGAIQCRSK